MDTFLGVSPRDFTFRLRSARNKPAEIYREVSALYERDASSFLLTATLVELVREVRNVGYACLGIVKPHEAERVFGLSLLLRPSIILETKHVHRKGCAPRIFLYAYPDNYGTGTRFPS